MRFYAKNSDCTQKQTQFKAIFTPKNHPQTQNKPNLSLRRQGSMLVKPPKSACGITKFRKAKKYEYELTKRK